MRKLLYFDTTTDWIVVGLYEIHESSIHTVHIQKESASREASYRLVPEIGKALQDHGWTRPDIISCAKGPGSFTGIRISVTTARDFSQVWNIPLIGLNTLEVYANYYFQKEQVRTLTILDGKMKKLFVHFLELDRSHGSYDIEPDELQKKFSLQEYKIYSDIPVFGATLYKEDFPEPKAYLEKHIQEIINLNTIEHNYSSLTPLYMRGTYAEGKKHGKNNT